MINHIPTFATFEIAFVMYSIAFIALAVTVFSQPSFCKETLTREHFKPQVNFKRRPAMRRFFGPDPLRHTQFWLTKPEANRIVIPATNNNVVVAQISHRITKPVVLSNAEQFRQMIDHQRRNPHMSMEAVAQAWIDGKAAEGRHKAEKCL
jgi:hypothetical protein